MKTMEKLKKLLRPIKRRLEHFIPDSIYIRWQYKKVTGKKLNLKNPQTFNEKLELTPTSISTTR